MKPQKLQHHIQIHDCQRLKALLRLLPSVHAAATVHSCWTAKLPILLPCCAGVDGLPRMLDNRPDLTLLKKLTNGCSRKAAIYLHQHDKLAEHFACTESPKEKGWVD